MLSPGDIERARNRDSAALDQLFQELFARTYSLLFRLTRDKATAEDLTQETFLKIHRNLDKLDPERDPWPWVATIATNVCRDHWGAAAGRLQSKSHSIDDEAMSDELCDPKAGPEETAQVRQDAGLVRTALEEVSDSTRLLVLLHDWQGFSHHEIAQMTGQTHVAVRQQYRRALATLASILRSLRP